MFLRLHEQKSNFHCNWGVSILLQAGQNCPLKSAPRSVGEGCFSKDRDPELPELAALPSTPFTHLVITHHNGSSIISTQGSKDQEADVLWAEGRRAASANLPRDRRPAV